MYKRQVLEIKRPRKRRYPLSDIVKKVNQNGLTKVEVDTLEWCNKSKINKVKQSRSEKSYTIRFKVGEMGKEEDIIRAIQSLSGQTIEQETPKRVSHRRAAKIRKRKLVSIDNVQIEEEEVQVTLRCEAGTYVKELVHSDDGRTNPSVQSAIGSNCEVIWLDVEEIHAE